MMYRYIIDIERKADMTQREISKIAGVSSATVSRVLNNDPKVRESTAKRVRSIINEHGYVGNMAAVNLRKITTKTVGFLIPEMKNSFFVNVLNECQDYFFSRDINLLFGCSNESVRRELKIMRSFLQYKVSGIIAAFVDCENEHVAVAKRMGVPIVMLEREKRDMSEEIHDSIKTDNYGGIEQIVDYLVGLGHKDIALLTGPLTLTPGYERYDGFCKAMKKHSLEVQQRYVICDTFSPNSGYLGVQKLLALPQRPTAIITASTIATSEAYMSLIDSRVSIPNEMSLIGFDDFDLATHLDPPITVVARPAIEMGSIIGDILLSKIGSEQDSKSISRIVLPTKLNVRGSCAPPRA